MQFATRVLTPWPPQPGKTGIITRVAAAGCINLTSGGRLCTHATDTESVLDYNGTGSSIVAYVIEGYCQTTGGADVNGCSAYHFFPDQRGIARLSQDVNPGVAGAVHERGQTLNLGLNFGGGVATGPIHVSLGPSGLLWPDQPLGRQSPAWGSRWSGDTGARSVSWPTVDSSDADLIPLGDRPFAALRATVRTRSGI
jgi:hypothetical protein